MDIEKILGGRQSPVTTQNSTQSSLSWMLHVLLKRQWQQSLLDTLPKITQGNVTNPKSEDICAERERFFNHTIISRSYPLPESRKHAIVVPFRDRHYHLQHFMDYMSRYLLHHFQNDTFTLWIVEQDDPGPFNRAFLFNVGLDHVPTDTQCISIHDVDLVPGFFNHIPYSECTRPVHLASESQTFKFKAFPEFVGAAFVMHQTHWAGINGMGNRFRGWGAEDNDLFARLMLHGMNECSGRMAPPVRPPKGQGVFLPISQESEHHVRGTWNRAHFKENAARFTKSKATGMPTSIVDGWNTARYEITAHELMDNSKLSGFSEIHHIKAIPSPEMFTPEEMAK